MATPYDQQEHEHECQGSYWLYMVRYVTREVIMHGGSEERSKWRTVTRAGSFVPGRRLFVADFCFAVEAPVRHGLNRTPLHALPDN